MKLQQNYLIGQEGQLRQEESQMGQEESQISQENSKIIADEFSNLLRSFEKESDTDFNKYH